MVLFESCATGVRAHVDRPPHQECVHNNRRQVVRQLDQRNFSIPEGSSPACVRDATIQIEAWHFILNGDDSAPVAAPSLRSATSATVTISMDA
jgi:hypothetical protein